MNFTNPEHAGPEEILHLILPHRRWLIVAYVVLFVAWLASWWWFPGMVAFSSILRGQALVPFAPEAYQVGERIRSALLILAVTLPVLQVLLLWGGGRILHTGESWARRLVPALVFGVIMTVLTWGLFICFSEANQFNSALESDRTKAVVQDVFDSFEHHYLAVTLLILAVMLGIAAVLLAGVGQQQGLGRLVQTILSVAWCEFTMSFAIELASARHGERAQSDIGIACSLSFLLLVWAAGPALRLLCLGHPAGPPAASSGAPS